MSADEILFLTKEEKLLLIDFFDWFDKECFVELDDNIIYERNNRLQDLILKLRRI